MTEIKARVGETAGKIWQLLSTEGPQTVAQMKKKLKDDSEYLNFALGWLTREDKIDICLEKRSYRVQLKE